MSFAAATVAGCGPSSHAPDAGDADPSGMDANIADAGTTDASDFGDALCFGGPDTGYGSPPFGWCCEHRCCEIGSWHGCPDPRDADADDGGL